MPVHRLGTTTLSEHDSKAKVAAYGVPIARELRAKTPEAAAAAAAEIGFPVAVKVHGARVTHKTERGFVRLGLPTADAVRKAAADMLAVATVEEGDVDLLIAEMVAGDRELIAGLSTDPDFGVAVMVGIGGIFAEALSDVAFRLAPITPIDALEMLEQLRSQALLGPLRGAPALDRGAVADVLLGLSRLAEAEREVVSVDLNPLIVRDGLVVCVDALVEVAA